MISGGKVLPRESHYEPLFDLSAKSHRHQLLWILLDRLICHVDRRIQNASEVIDRLEQIKAWEKCSIILPPIVSQNISFITEQDARARNVSQINIEIIKRREREFTNFSASLAEWVKQQLTEASIALNVNETLEASVSVDTSFRGQTHGKIEFGGQFRLTHQWSVSLDVKRLIQPTVTHSLMLVLGRPFTVCVRSGSGPFQEEDRPCECYVIPLYARRAHGQYQYPPNHTHISLLEAVPVFPGRKPIAYPGQLKLLLRGDAGKWPMDRAEYEQLIRHSLEVFIEILTNGAPPHLLQV